MYSILLIVCAVADLPKHLPITAYIMLRKPRSTALRVKDLVLRALSEAIKPGRWKMNFLI